MTRLISTFTLFLLLIFLNVSSATIQYNNCYHRRPPHHHNSQSHHHHHHQHRHHRPREHRHKCHPPSPPPPSAAPPPEEESFVCNTTRLIPCATMGQAVLAGQTPLKSPCCPTIIDYLNTTPDFNAFLCILQAWDEHIFGPTPQAANNVTCAAYFYCRQTPLPDLGCEDFPIPDQQVLSP